MPYCQSLITPKNMLRSCACAVSGPLYRHQSISNACRSDKVEKADEAYFDSYGYFDIHRTMLGDKVRCWSGHVGSEH